MSQPPPTIYTTPAQLDGTTTGIVITAVVAVISLAVLIGLVYWANNHPNPKQSTSLQLTQKGHGAVHGGDPDSLERDSGVPANSSAVSRHD
jgi:hypothetical protein